MSEEAIRKWQGQVVRDAHRAGVASHATVRATPGRQEEENARFAQRLAEDLRESLERQRCQEAMLKEKQVLRQEESRRAAESRQLTGAPMASSAPVAAERQLTYRRPTPEPDPGLPYGRPAEVSDNFIGAYQRVGNFITCNSPIGGGEQVVERVAAVAAAKPVLGGGGGGGADIVDQMVNIGANLYRAYSARKANRPNQTSGLCRQLDYNLNLKKVQKTFKKLANQLFTVADSSTRSNSQISVRASPMDFVQLCRSAQQAFVSGSVETMAGNLDINGQFDQTVDKTGNKVQLKQVFRYNPGPEFTEMDSFRVSNVTCHFYFSTCSVLFQSGCKGAAIALFDAIADHVATPGLRYNMKMSADQLLREYVPRLLPPLTKPIQPPPPHPAIPSSPPALSSLSAFHSPV